MDINGYYYWLMMLNNKLVIINNNGIGYPLVMTNSWLLKLAIEIVDLPMKNGDVP